MTVTNVQNQLYLGAVSVAVIVSEMVGGGLAMLLGDDARGRKGSIQGWAWAEWADWHVPSTWN